MKNAHPVMKHMTISSKKSPLKQTSSDKEKRGSSDYGLKEVLRPAKIGEQKFGLPKGAKIAPEEDRRPQFVKNIDNTYQATKAAYKEGKAHSDKKSVGQHLKHIGKELFVEPFKKK